MFPASHPMQLIVKVGLCRHAFSEEGTRTLPLLWGQTLCVRPRKWHWHIIVTKNHSIDLFSVIINRIGKTHVIGNYFARAL